MVCRSLLGSLSGVIFMLGMQVLPAPAQHSQEVALHQGWNAVAFEVVPSVADPSGLFGPVEEITEVVGHIPAAVTASFLQNPGETLNRSKAWPRWRRDGTAAVLNDLGQVQPRLPYFIHASAGTTFAVQGVPAPLTWPPEREAFNFVSLPVNDQQPVTYGEYFQFSPIKPVAAFRLRENNWEALHPNTILRRNEVYCLRFDEVPSNYSGPIQFSNLPAARALPLNSQSGAASVDYAGFSPEVQVGLIMDLVGGDLQLNYRDGFLAEEEVPLTGTAMLQPLGVNEAGRLYLNADNHGQAVVRFRDSLGLTAFFMQISHPPPE